MAVNWLKGLVAPAAFGGTPAGAPGQPGRGGHPPFGPGVPHAGDLPPVGGSPSPYGVAPPGGSPGPLPGMPAGAPPPPPMAGALPDAMQWSTGTRTQASADAPPVAAPTFGASGSAADPRVAALEARCAELSSDVASLALFARTLLTLLEDAKIVTRAQFLETKNRLDALDGRVDDR